MQILDIPRLDVFEREALAAITRVLQAGRRLIIAYSGGKDSTTILLLALNAARALREQGVAVPPILITHGDTGVENPLVATLARSEMVKACAYGQKHDFEVRAEIAQPLLNDTWAVAILSGRKLPTFSNASSRDCTVMFKITPMKRLRNQVLYNGKARGRRKTKNAATAPVTLIGTRFEESDGRATRMNERGETAYQPWEKAGAWYMSVIANWDMGDVWSYLAKYRDGSREGFTDARAIFDMYASATDDNTCAVVGDMATENAKKSRACGARFGCSLCAAVGRDKSLEAQLNYPENAWLRPLNRIQRFLVDTQYAWNRRNWVGRSLNNGFLKIVPDNYSPAMLRELLRYCLTADADEARAAAREGIRPRFELVSFEQLLAIDALWSLNSIQKQPFAALAIWHEVHNKRMRFYPPEDLEPAPATGMPTARYLEVGPNWDDGENPRYLGFRDAMLEGFGGGGCRGTRTLADGRVVLDAALAPNFSFDPEALMMFMDYEMDYVLEKFYADSRSVCTEGFYHYVKLGILGTSETHVKAHIDRILHRSHWRHRQGLTGDIDLPALWAKTVSKKEMLAKIAAQEQAVQRQEVSTPEVAPEVTPEVVDALEVSAEPMRMVA